jgi:hypothetical protein
MPPKRGSEPPETNHTPDLDGRLSADAVHDLLAARRRRYVLYCLYLYANPMRLPDIAEQVTQWEHGRPGDELLDERLRVYNNLYHRHVPKLVDFGVVGYSQTEDMLELGANAPQLRPHLERAAEVDLSPDGPSPL